MKISLASDHAGFELKCAVKQFLLDQGHLVEDFGTNNAESVDYSDFGIKVASKISSGDFEHGILVCGTGLGMSMVANRFKYVRAALCNDIFSAMMSRQHNDSNLLVLGGRVIGMELAKQIVNVWLKTDFEGGRHKKRIDKFDTI